MKIIPSFFVLMLLILPLITEAFTTFESVPFIGNENMTTEGYINAMYRLIIGAAVLLAVIKLIIAGLKYMLSDLVTSQADAKKDIKASIIGLLIILGATTLFNTINPNINKLDILSGATSVSVGDTTSVSVGDATNGGTKIPCKKETYAFYNCKDAIASCTKDGGTYSERPNLIYCLIPTDN